MADIKNYLKEKEKRENQNSDYQSVIRKHKMSNMYKTIIAIVLVIIAIVIFAVQQANKKYTDYEILSSVLREKAADAVDMQLGNTVLTYSKDGAHCTRSDGIVTWNQTYEMQDIQTAINKNVVAIADYNGRNIYVQDTEQTLGQVTTTMPIKNLAVAENGNVTAVLEDSDVAWLNTYSAGGEMLYKGQTHMHDSGYPAALSLSPNGELLAASFVYVDAGVLKTNIEFYNFGPVGMNQSDFVTGVYTYTDLLVPEINFMNNASAFAVGDGRLMFYKGSEKPVLEAEYLFSEELLSVYYNEKYVGMVYTSDNAESKYVVRIYDADGRKVNDIHFDIEYTKILFDKDSVVVYNDTECNVITMDGTVKYNGKFKKTTNLMIPTEKKYRYMLVTNDSIDIIQLR